MSKPQPLSNADKKGGGANPGTAPGGCGAYCSTRDGSASQNGNGGGKATGKPCAGCVGKADNKNPQGQRENGNDHNNGYECDGNNGIGKGNPAHTSCVSGSVPPKTTPEKPGKPDHPGTPSTCSNGKGHGNGNGNGKGCAPTQPTTPTTPVTCSNGHGKGNGNGHANANGKGNCPTPTTPGTPITDSLPNTPGKTTLTTPVTTVTVPSVPVPGQVSGRLSPASSLSPALRRSARSSRVRLRSPARPVRPSPAWSRAARSPR